MTGTKNQRKANKDLMAAILQVLEGGNLKEIATKVNMDPQELSAMSDSFARQTFQDAVLGEAGKRKIGRNEPCSCGSGKKYKKCCLRKHEEARKLLHGTKAVDFQQPEAEEGPPQYVVKGFDLLAAGSYDEAIGYAKDLLSTYPEDDRLHDTLASAQLAKCKYDQAIDICRSRLEVSKEEKSFFLEHGHHQRLPSDEKGAPPHFYAPETWLEKYWIALKSKEYSTHLPDPPDPEIEALIVELLTANDLERFPAQQEKGFEERRQALAPTLEELKQVGSDALPYLLQVMSRYCWAALFVPEIIAHYSTDAAIRSLMDLTMFNYHFVSEACLKHLQVLGADVLPHIRAAFTRDKEFDLLKVGFINMMSNLDAVGADELLLELLESEEDTLVDWAGLALGKRNRTDLLAVLEGASSRIGGRPRIFWAINHLKKISEGSD